MSRRRLVSALLFSPRGGSAHVARALARELPDHGWDVTVVSGSRGDLGDHGDARRFYAALDVRPAPFDAALRAPDPLHPPAGAVPMHPSFEDRPGAPDPVFAALDDRAYERQADAWARVLADARAHEADALHLHHLTPLHEAAARVAPGVPVLGHLHGTELLMLEAIEDGADWPHAEAWAKRMRSWAHRCERLVLLSETQLDRAERLLGIPDDGRFVVIPNGFDPRLFRRRDVDREALWRHHLVERPQGERYTPQDLRPLLEGTVVVSVSRFTAVKRIPVLVEAFAAARERVGEPTALVLVGGHPDEHEGEHPRDLIARLDARDVFLAGWHDHDELPHFLSAADVFALASVREQFGQVFVEAMACEVAPVGVDAYGPSQIIEDGRTGWLVAPDDPGALAAALVQALDDPEERARRAAAARETAVARYAWPSLAGRLAEVLGEVATAAPVA